MVEAVGIETTDDSRVDSFLFTERCEGSMKGAVISYDEPISLGGAGRIEDLGLGLILDGSGGPSLRVIDLGSGQLRRADLSRPVVIFGWFYRSMVRRLADSVDRGSPPGRGWWNESLDLLARSGFCARSRPIFLRAGFRDMVEDLDLHETLSVRMSRPGGMVRSVLDTAESTLDFRTSTIVRDPEFESALSEAFPSWSVERSLERNVPESLVYRVALPRARTMKELRLDLRRIRRGFHHLLARFEPDRHAAIREMLSGFGERDSLASLRDRKGGRETAVRRSAGARLLGGQPSIVPASTPAVASVRIH